MNLSLLIVEDDEDLAAELGKFLAHAGFAVRHAATIADAEAALEDAPDLLMLNINLPDGSGLDLCRRFSESRHTGVVMCTAREERDLRITSLNDGADAYLVKPVDPEELEATLRSVHRRLQAVPASPLLLRPKVHPWRLDLSQSLLTAPNGVNMLLQEAEAKLIKLIFSQASRTATRDQLLALFDDSTNANYRLEALVSRLRRKINEKSGLKLPLVSHYGKGYGFNAPAQFL